MATVTIPQTEYLRLAQQANAYQKITASLFEFVIKDPTQEVVADFKKTNLYTEGFLNDLEDGLRKSSYRKNHIRVGSTTKL